MAETFPKRDRPEMTPGNSVPPVGKQYDSPTPKGPQASKIAQSQLALKGLIGSK